MSPKFDKTTNYLIDITVQVVDNHSTQTGFWVSEKFILTCAHGFSHLRTGDHIKILNEDVTFKAKVLAIDQNIDILLLESNGPTSKSCAKLQEVTEIGEQLASWGYTEKHRKGEAIQIIFEGWARAPFLLKLSKGQVVPGMSGAPIFSLESNKVVGMIKRTRDRSSDLGGRGVPASALIEFIDRHTQGDFDIDILSKVTENDFKTIFGILDSAYQSAKPVTPIQLSELEKFCSDWKGGKEALRELYSVTDSFYDDRNKAIIRWFNANPNCLKFIVNKKEKKRVGITCVLPITRNCYNKYITGIIKEFEISIDDLINYKKDRYSRWLCFQSFAISDKFNRKNLKLLRNAMIEHVKNLSAPYEHCVIVAEIGTSAGFKEAKYFNMEFRGLSKETRPLFEIDYDTMKLQKVYPH